MSHKTLMRALIGWKTERPALGPGRERARRRATYEGMEPLEVRELLSATATQLIIGLQPTNGYVGLKNPFALTVELTDSSGNVVTSDHSAVTLSDSSGSLAKTLIGRPKNGIVTFSNLLFTQEGTFTLTATDTADGLTKTTGQIVIQAAPVAQTIEFSQAPVSDPTGANPGDVQVSIKDQYGNDYAVPTNVTLSLVNPGAGDKLVGKLSVKTSGGVADFPGLSVNQADQYQIQASASVGGTTLTVTSDELTMGGPTTAHSIQFLAQPTDTAAGAFMAPVTVEVLDQFGQVVPTDHSRVTIVLPTSGGKAKKVNATAKNGIATFNRISLTTVGQYQFSATDGNLTGATSDSFNIIPGAATKLVFEAAPASGGAAADPMTVKVDTVDKFGNVDTTNAAAITLVTALAPRGATPLSLVVNAVDGVATFDITSFPSAGRFSLKVTADGLKSAQTKPFALM